MNAPLTTRQQLKKVSSNFYRHAGNLKYYGMRTVGGKKVTRCLETADKMMAGTRLRKWLESLSNTDPGRADVTLDGLIASFVKMRSGLSHSTTRSYTTVLTEFRRSFPCEMKTLVSRVKPSDIATWLVRVRKGKRANTFNNLWRMCVRQLFKLAEDDGLLTKSPFSDRLIPRAKKEKILRLVPTADEFDKLIKEIRYPTWERPKGKAGGQRQKSQHRSADFAAWLGLAGVGQAEAAALKWENIDEARGCISYRRQKTGRNFESPIYEWLKPLIAEMRARCTGVPTGPIFAIDDVGKALESACKRAGLPHFTQRSLRAFLIGHLWKAGVDVKLIALWQGHRDGGKLIMDTYTEVFGSNDESYAQTQLAKAGATIMQSSKAETSPRAARRRPAWHTRQTHGT